MPDTGMFLVQNNGDLVRLVERAYDSEAILQQLLAQYPEVLAGDADGTRARQLTLIKQEMAVPGDDSVARRLYLDHLFLDQDGIPTLVEVKRSSDARIRREVVGQMLDYAANAVVHWSVEQLQSDLAATANATGQDPEWIIAEMVGDEESGTFWQKVKTNLQAGRVRLVFVADAIPNELRRVVEFLNEQMDPAEVIAIEVRQFVGEGIRTLVPNVIGRTAEARAKKEPGATSSDPWTRETFLERVAQESGDAEASVASRILEWATEKNLRIWWGRGQTEARFYPMFDYATGTQYLTAVCHGRNGFIQLQLPQMRAPFDYPAKREELVSRVERATGQSLGPNPKYPGIRFSVLKESGRLERFLETMDWVMSETTRAASGDG